MLILHFQVINLGVFCLGSNFPLNLQVLCNGVVHLKIPKFGDHITWNRATLCIHNVVVGKLWIDNYGEVLVQNHSTGEMARVRFHKATSQQQCHISGKIYDAVGAPQYTLFGNYMDRIYACPEACTNFDVNGPDVRLLWKAPEMIEDYHQQYCFTAFTLGLNDLTPKLAEVLPPTDSRFRPDQRALVISIFLSTPYKPRLTAFDVCNQWVMYLILSSSMPVTLYGETFCSLQSDLRSMPFSMLFSSFLEIDPYGSFLFVDNAGLLHTGEWRLGKSYT
jgi:hypothetical protein